MDEALALLFKAMLAPKGLAVTPTGDASAFLQRLYRARKGQPFLAVLTFQRRENEIWIIRKD